MILVTWASCQELDTKDNVESVTFQPVEDLWTIKSSWIIFIAIDMNHMERDCLTLETMQTSVGKNMPEFYRTFKLEDERYMKLINMAREDLDIAIDRLTDYLQGFSA